MYRIASCAAPTCRVVSFRRVQARAESGGCLSVPQTGACPTVRPSRFWAPGARRVHDRGRSGVPLHTVRTKVASLLVEGVARWCVVLIKCASHGRTPHDPTKDVRSACARAPRPAAWVAAEAAVQLQRAGFGSRGRSPRRDGRDGRDGNADGGASSDSGLPARQRKRYGRDGNSTRCSRFSKIVE